MTGFLDELGRNLADAADRLDRPAKRRVAPRLVALAVAATVVVAIVVGLVVRDAPSERSAVPPDEATVTATATANPRRPDRIPPLIPVDEALARVDRYVNVPVGVPAGLPAGTRALRRIYLFKRGGVPTAQMGLRLPGERSVLSVVFGTAGFDGCGPTDPRVVDVNGEPGLLTTSPPRQRTGSTVVWPATLPGAEGTYNLTGPFTPDEILAFARGTQLSGDGGIEPTGC